MKRIKLSRYIIMVWVFHFVIYNTYFGWNELPIDESEKYQDIISKILLYLWLFFYFSPIYGLYEDAISRFEKRKELEKEINKNLN